MTGRWQPSAPVDTLRARALLLRAIREFFHQRGVMEVDVPALSRHGTVDRHIDSFRVRGAGYLHTSPEFGMKRLLAAGAGPIFQLSHVFRAGESGRWHNPEFMMLEWYRPGWPVRPLMDEVEALVRSLVPALPAFEHRTYAEVFARHAEIDPHRAPLEHLREAALARGVTGTTTADRDACLDALMAVAIAPQLGHERPLFVRDFPASQAALARVREGDPPVAERFELFWRGCELANGFEELTDAREQERRFRADRAARKAARRDAPPHDRWLIQALRAGMPAAAGVALGVDRLLMLALGLGEVAAAMPFSYERA